MLLNSLSVFRGTLFLLVLRLPVIFGVLPADLPDLRPTSCSSNTDCPNYVQARCDTSTNTCQNCINNSDCDHLHFPGQCISVGTDKVCLVPCNATDREACWAMRAVCKTTYSSPRCRRCDTSAECSELPGTTFCNVNGVYNLCVHCLNNTHCSAGYTCQNYKCVQCTSDSNCAAPTPYCLRKFEGNTCKECLSNQHCLNDTHSKCVNNICTSCTQPSDCLHITGKQFCDSTSHVCRACSIDAECAHVTGLNVCWQGQCVNSVPTTPPTPTSPTNTSNTTTTNQTMTSPLSKEAEKAVETATKIGDATKAASTALAGISGSMMLAGANPALLWALIGLFQIFYYMIFINVNYPANVRIFFPIFTLGNLDFIPNPLKWIIKDIEDYSLPVPEKYEENKVDGFFLSNAGNMLLLWFLVMSGYMFSKLFIRYTRNMPSLAPMACNRVVLEFEWSGVIRTFITSYMELNIAAFLQLRVLIWTSAIFSISSICGILFTLFGLILPLVTYRITKKNEGKINVIKRKYKTLIQEFRSEDQIPKYFSTIFLVKRLFISVVLVFLHDFPYFETVSLTLIYIICTYLLWKFRPYSYSSNNICSIISEGVFAIVHLLIVVLAHDDYAISMSEDSRLSLGWGIIGGCGIILGATLILMIIEQITVLKNIIQMIIKLIKKKKGKAANKNNILVNKIKPVMEKSFTSFNELSQLSTFHLSPDLILTDLNSVSLTPKPSIITPNQTNVAKRQKVEMSY